MASKYVLVYNDITTRIQSGMYPAGSRLPAENLLIREYGVSRDTLRKALAMLEQDGYIQKARGEVSTSPSVVFCGASGGAEVPDVMGEDNFFIEGTPFLIDHVALVPLGVWDKGGKPSGVEVTTPTAEEQLAGMVRDVIDAACKPALEKLEEISGRLAQLEKEG